MVSVIIPTYNRSPFLRKAIDSVLAQTFRDFELIVVDSRSTDDTPRLLAELGDTVTVLQIARGNPGAARNLGMGSSRALLIAFLDSDDRWHPEKLAVQIEAMRREPGYPISHTQEIWYSGGRVLPQRPKHRKYHGWIFPHCLPLCAVSPSTVIARRELFDEIGLFDESLVCCEDYDLWLRASASHPFLLVDRALTFKDGGREDQMSRIHRVGMDRHRIRSLAKALSAPGLLDDAQRTLALGELGNKCRIYGQGCLKHRREDEGNRYLALPAEIAARGGERTGNSRRVP
jgi:glycosyltransferase involved in cell wall biosynthesis